jgi:predicted dehydrogenase
MRDVGIGIIGCGNISGAYLTAAKAFPWLKIRGLADQNPAAAEAKAAEFGLPATSVETLLADPEVEIVVNLTIPQAHVEVGLRALMAGKHVHSEKPLGIAVEEARRLVGFCESRGLRVGCAPDTFLGGAQQTCRKLVDEGAIGQPVAGTAFFMCPGHERWHPNPAFYYAEGGGPMLDMGPYYITALVNLLGPVARVAGAVATPRKRRPITSEPLRGQMIEVAVPTHVAGTLEFVSGPVVTMAMSFDVPKHRHGPIELYGTEGGMIVPDPNRFDGQIEIAKTGADWRPFYTQHAYADGNYRILGVADMAAAIVGGRPHRASGALALHALEVMEAFGRSAEAGRHIEIATRPERPAMLPVGLATGRLD